MDLKNEDLSFLAANDAKFKKLSRAMYIDLIVLLLTVAARQLIEGVKESVAGNALTWVLIGISAAIAAVLIALMAMHESASRADSDKFICRYVSDALAPYNFLEGEKVRLICCYKGDENYYLDETSYDPDLKNDIDFNTVSLIAKEGELRADIDFKPLESLSRKYRSLGYIAEGYEVLNYVRAICAVAAERGRAPKEVVVESPFVKHSPLTLVSDGQFCDDKKHPASKNPYIKHGIIK